MPVCNPCVLCSSRSSPRVKVDQDPSTGRQYQPELEPIIISSPGTWSPSAAAEQVVLWDLSSTHVQTSAVSPLQRESTCESGIGVPEAMQSHCSGFLAGCSLVPARPLSRATCSKRMQRCGSMCRICVRKRIAQPIWKAGRIHKFSLVHDTHSNALFSLQENLQALWNCGLATLAHVFIMSLCWLVRFVSR